MKGVGDGGKSRGGVLGGRGDLELETEDEGERKSTMGEEPMEARPKGGGQSMGVRAVVPGPGDDLVEGREIGVLANTRCLVEGEPKS